LLLTPSRMPVRFLFAFILTLGLASAQPRIVILGVDGMDYNVARAEIDAGRLPALAALATQGTFRPLRPTNPAQSPVSWSSLTTGGNPGRTGIFDFVAPKIRDGRVFKELALVEKVEHVIFGTPGRIAAFAFVAVLCGFLSWLFRRRRIAQFVVLGLVA